MPSSIIKSHWSFFPALKKGRLNITEDKDAVKNLVLHYLLLRKGEHPLEPSLGLPDIIFRPVAEVSEEAFAAIIREDLLNLNRIYKLGLSEVNVFSVQSSSNWSMGVGVGHRPVSTPNNFFIEIYLKFDKDPPVNISVDYRTLARTIDELIT